MIWLLALGLISLFLIIFGILLAMKRLRMYRKEAEAKRAQAFEEMKKAAQGQGIGNQKKIRHP
jgi:hypothetical protein